jgi:hypothetical protein
MSGIEKLKTFAKSPHHAWLALLTLGIGVATLSGIGCVAGAAAYALGWIYLPDSPLLKRWINARKQGDESAKLRDFLLRRRQIYDALRPASRKRYDALSRDIEALQDEYTRDHRLDRALVQQRNERLSNLAWTYLRLLHTGEMLDRFAETEDAAALEKQIAVLENEISALAPGTQPGLADSLQARLGPLKSRLQKRLDAEQQRTLTLSEQERIAELVMLYRADHLASRDGGALSHEIDGAASQLERTRDWLRDLEFDTSPADIPAALAAAAPLKVSN